MDWQGLLALSQTQVWGDFSDTAQRKIAVERARIRIPKVLGSYGRATDSRQFHRSVLEGLDVAFEWVQWVNYKNLVEVLLFAFGNDTVTGSNPYIHSYSTENAPNSLPSFSLFLDQGIDTTTPTINIGGCKVDELRLENNSSNILRATINGVGKSHRDISALSVSSDDCDQFGLSPFIFSDLAFTLGLNGTTRSAETGIESLQIRLRNNLIKRVPASISNFVIEPVEGMVEVSGSFRMELDDWSEFDVFIADQQVDLSATWTTGIYSLTITIQNARFTVLPLPEARGSSRRSVVEIQFEGLYDGSDTITAVLVTTEPSIDLASSSSSSQSSSSSSSNSSSSSSSDSSSSSSSSSQSSLSSSASSA